MLVISLDPSPVNTAVVVFEPAAPGSLFAAGTMPILPAAQWLHQYLTTHPGALVVIEKPPLMSRGMNEFSSQTIAAYWMLYWIAEADGAMIKAISPGSWKPSAKRWAIAYPPQLADQHQKDAYAMAVVSLQAKEQLHALKPRVPRRGTVGPSLGDAHAEHHDLGSTLETRS